MVDRNTYPALAAHEVPYDAHLHPEENPRRQDFIAAIVIEGSSFFREEAPFLMWLDAQLDDLRTKILAERRRRRG